MKLQNGYKFIYEKEVEGKRHLFAGKGSVPTEDDVEVKFDSLTEDKVKAFKLIYEAGECFKGAEGAIPSEDDKAFALTDGEGAILAGDGYSVTKAEADPEPEEDEDKKTEDSDERIASPEEDAE